MPRKARERELSLDELLAVLGNPLRREILARLTQETHYPLQLSRELRVSQQAIMKHLSVLRRYRLVRCAERRSSRLGPPRNCYVSTGSFSIRIDLGPGAFEARLIPLESGGRGRGGAGSATDGSGGAAGILSATEGPEGSGENVPAAGSPGAVEGWGGAAGESSPAARLRELIGVLNRINHEVSELERRRASLAGLKQEVLREACGVIAEMSDDYRERRLLYLLTEDPETPLEELSRELSIRRERLERICRMIGIGEELL